MRRTADRLAPNGAALWMCLVFGVSPPCDALAGEQAPNSDQPVFIDTSLLVATEYPCTWPTAFPPFIMNHYVKIGPTSAYNSDVIFIDENTGTQFDAPTHSVAPPESKLP